MWVRWAFLALAILSLVISFHSAFGCPPACGIPTKGCHDIMVANGRRCWCQWRWGLGTSRRLQPVKTKARRQGRGVAVLSLFDGVCYGLLALHRAGIAVREYWRVENDHWCNVVAERPRFSEACLCMCDTVDIMQLMGDEVGPGYPIWEEVGLIVYGFPCQGVSRANVKGLGLADPRSGLLFHAIRITKMVEAVAVKVVKLVECVARWNKPDHFRFACGKLEMDHLVVCSGQHSYAKRERTYWASYPLKQPPRVSADANDILDAGREVRGTNGEPVKKLASLMVKTKSWSTKNTVCDGGKQRFNTLRVEEAERAMGWSVGHTSTGEGQEREPEEGRLKMVGNGFNVATVAAMQAQGRKEINEAAKMINKGGQTPMR